MIWRVAHVAGDHQRCDSVVVGLIDISASLDEQLHDFETFCGGFAFAVALDEPESRGSFDHRLSVASRPSLGSAPYARRSLVSSRSAEKAARISAVANTIRGEPGSHARPRRVIDHGVRLCSSVEQLFDQRQGSAVTIQESSAPSPCSVDPQPRIAA